MVRMCILTKNHHCFGVMNYDAMNQAFVSFYFDATGLCKYAFNMMI